MAEDTDISAGYRFKLRPAVHLELESCRKLKAVGLCLVGCTATNQPTRYYGNSSTLSSCTATTHDFGGAFMGWTAKSRVCFLFCWCALSQFALKVVRQDLKGPVIQPEDKVGLRV